MWAEAAKWLAKFDEAVLTGVDADDYPVSIRVNPGDYDARTGTLAEPPRESRRRMGVPEQKFRRSSETGVRSFPHEQQHRGQKYLDKRGLQRPPINWAQPWLRVRWGYRIWRLKPKGLETCVLGYSLKSLCHLGI